MRGLDSFLKDAWRLAAPYYRSEEKVVAWALLLAVIALNLSTVGMSVVLSYWNREFFNALQTKDFSAFTDLLLTYRRTDSGLMPGFVWVIVLYIFITVYENYLQAWLEMRWRRWLTDKYLNEWLADRAYYRISLTTDQAALGTDNPDQRISQDLKDFTRNTLDLSLGLLRQIVSLASFVTILWGLSGVLTVMGVDVPGYMVWVAVIYAVIGTWIAHLIGRPLIGLRFRQERVEADFRYALVRLRENVEGIALYGGEREEKGFLQTRFQNIVGNWWEIMRRTKYLNLMVFGYDNSVIVFPYVVAAPRYFSGQIPLGGLSQTAGAFGRVHHALSWFIDAYQRLAVWRAEVERLMGFQRAIMTARAAAGQAIASDISDDAALHLHAVTLELPDGTKLTETADLTLPAGRSVILTGRSGSGKSTLFRALAGIWPFGSGQIGLPQGKLLFLPQRTYMPLGALKYVVSYPDAPEEHGEPRITQALTDAGLAHLIPQLDADENWAQRLSGGEQQRVALARALLMKPDWLFLDEATASLDTEAEAEFYRILRERLPGCTIISIAHRPTVAAFHEDRVVLQSTPGEAGSLSQPV
ncbi:MAG: ABC transporter ATP-binding protein/permease [Acetobacteraceae bacterium]|nr:ABC transporter ATP-binding protein/permease [Acetobacteraceae bacterium]